MQYCSHRASSKLSVTGTKQSKFHKRISADIIILQHRSRMEINILEIVITYVPIRKNRIVGTTETGRLAQQIIRHIYAFQSTRIIRTFGSGSVGCYSNRQTQYRVFESNLLEHIAATFQNTQLLTFIQFDSPGQLIVRKINLLEIGEESGNRKLSQLVVRAIQLRTFVKLTYSTPLRDLIPKPLILISVIASTSVLSSLPSPFLSKVSR